MIRFRAALIVGGLAIALSACSGPTDSEPASQSTPTPPPAQTPSSTSDTSFTQVRHIVLEDPAPDTFETVTAVVHMCEAGEVSCPNGEEPMMVLASHRFTPNRIYLHHPDMTLVPPQECLQDGMDCRVSLMYCEYPDERAQMSGRHCVPSHDRLASLPGDSTSSDDCSEQVTALSHHVDYACMTGKTSSDAGAA